MQTHTEAVQAAPSPPMPAHTIERVLRITHSLDYRYASPARNVATRLRLMPPEVRGTQLLRTAVFRQAPLPTRERQYTDPFGNLVLEVEHEQVWQHLTLIVELETRTTASYSADGRLLHTYLAPEQGLPAEGEIAFRQPTVLTTPDPALEEIATEVLGEHTALQDPHYRDKEGLAFALCRRVYTEMRYTKGFSTVRTTAAEAWAARKGVCQDYAHVLIVLCRLAGLPARYVSGFLPGEGAMHAWVEVLIPVSEGGEESRHPGGWVALDPTHARWVNERYVTIAAGRDYADVSPTSGKYTGKGRGVLSHKSRVIVESTRKTPV